MSLREEMARYEQLTGESAEHIPISRLGGYLDGVDKGIEEFEKIKTEIEGLKPNNPNFKNFIGETRAINNVLEVIDKRISKLKGE